MNSIVKVTVNNEQLAAVLGVKSGDQIDVQLKNGVPIVKEWRNRFKDAATDKCITIPQTKAEKKPGGK